MTDHSEVFAIPQSWSKEEVATAYGITADKIDCLTRAGVVGYIVGKNRAHRFMAEHISQIRNAIEVKPAPAVQPDDYAFIGATRRASRRRAS